MKYYEITAAKVKPITASAATLDEWTRALPSGFYTTFTTLAGGTKAMGFSAHLRRLYEPAARLGLNSPLNAAQLRARLVALIAQNLPAESRVRLLLTRGGKLYLALQPFHSLPKQVYTRGVCVLSAELARRAPQIKDSAFIAQSAEQRKQVNKNIFEILLTKNGNILEGMTSNFYAMQGEAIFTAQRGILPGVTRRAVLRIAKGQGLSVIYRAPSLGANFDEAFLTSSSRGVVPIVKIDHRKVGDGRVGEWTKRLMQAYWEYVEKKAEEIGG